MIVITLIKLYFLVEWAITKIYTLNSYKPLLLHYIYMSSQNTVSQEPIINFVWPTFCQPKGLI